MLPVFGREVVESQQRVAILNRAFDRLVVFDGPGFDEGVERRERILLGLCHPDLLERPLGLRVLALRQLVQDVGRLVDPAALAAGLRPHLLERLPEAERAVGDCEFGRYRKPAPLQVEEQFPPGLGALAHAVNEADELLLALRRGADDDQQALGLVLQSGLHVDAVGPEVDVALGGEIASAPAYMLLRPGILEPSDGRGREPAGLLAEQCDERFLEVAGGDALEIEDRDQHLEALRTACVWRQDRRREPNPFGAFARAVAHPWTAHRDRTDAGHDFALGQMPVAHQPLVAIIGELVGMAADQGGNLRLDGPRQQRSRAVAKHLGQRIGECPWLGGLENISLGHGVSLLRWRSGRLRTPPRYAASTLQAVTNFRG